MTASFALNMTQAATQIRLRSLAASREGACLPHPRDARRGWDDYGYTFGRWPE